MTDDVMDVTDRIERLELFEERLGVQLEGLSAFVERGFLTVRGELHPRNGTELNQDTELVVAAYDATSRVIGTASNYFTSEDFFGIETFELSINLPIATVARVRVYPKKA
ncbi:MAG: hypothetical protein RBS80_20325 [Thermoguttaceae bacterium]|jgi:hypothetical protein|nr:hypothetical protein [Thermoguttaceae bacterium]